MASLHQERRSGSRAWKAWLLMAPLLGLLLPVNCMSGVTGRGPDRPPRAKVAKAGVNTQALSLLERRTRESHSHAVMVVKNGKTVFEWYSGDGRKPMESMSITKSVTSLAIGRLITTGRLKSIDEPVHHFYPEWNHGKKRLITIRHLLNHTSGLKDSTQAGPGAPESPDLVRLALDSGLVSDPGTRFAYNNSAVNLLSGIVSKVSGMRLDRFVGDEIFGPLGIRDFSWTLDGAGNALAMTGLHITAPDLIRIGQLMLNKGTWKGTRIVSAEWVRLAVSPAQPFNPGSGLLWWIMAPPSSGFYARGHLGQYLVVIPAGRLVAARQTRLSGVGGEDLAEFPALVQGLMP